MRTLLQQFITVYSTEKMTVTVDCGDELSGRPYALFKTPNTNPNAGLFQLADENGVPLEAVPVCHIAAVHINNGVYKDTLEYVQEPASLPEGCGADCFKAIRSLIPAGTERVSIRAGGRTFGEGTVKKSEYGVAVLVGPNDSDPVFISICKAEIIKI